MERTLVGFQIEAVKHFKQKQHACIRYTGEKLLEQKVEVLLEARWQPAPPDTFPDRPQSPRANGSAPAPTAAAKPSGYVLPHLRGSAGATFFWLSSYSHPALFAYTIWHVKNLLQHERC